MDRLINIFFGCLITSIAVIILRHSYIVTGGVAGLSLMASYFFDTSFSTIFFAINMPFFIFAFAKLGWKFTVSTLSAVTILSLMTVVDKWLPLFTIPTFIGAVLGGIIAGFGLSIIAINGASLGGTNMMAIFLQKRYGINPGTTNFIFDFLVVILSFYTVDAFKGLLSILSIAITSSIISYFKGRISNSPMTKVHLREAS